MKVSIADLTKLASPETEAWLTDLVLQAYERRGADWLAEIAAEYPLAAWFADLAINKTADEAIEAIAAEYPHLPVAWFEPKLRGFHARIQTAWQQKRG